MLCLRLRDPLLLTAIAALVASVASIERDITCDDAMAVQRLSCEYGVISVKAALYGRANTRTCSAGRPQGELQNTNCAQEGTMEFLKTRCDGKKVCEHSTSIVRTSDPCPGIFKYLETNYTCLPALRVTTCEHAYAHLTCDVGQVIHVYGADYGRRDRTTCSYQRPESQLQNTICLGPTKAVAERCNGQNSCVVKATNAMFGDPCLGTYKYLEVAYVCEYSLGNPEEYGYMLK